MDAEYLITGDSAGGVIKFMAILEAFYALGCYNVNFASRKKPSQEGSRTLQNWIFIKYGSNYLIDRRCLGLLGDMASVKVTMFGGIDDPDTIRNDIGHFSDATRYKDYNFEYKNYEAKTGEKLGYRIQRKIHQYTGD